MKKLSFLLILGILISYGCSKGLDENSVRTTEQGELIGYKEDNTFAWRGIPLSLIHI